VSFDGKLLQVIYLIFFTSDREGGGSGKMPSMRQVGLVEAKEN